jgi:hypothetical protein
MPSVDSATFISQMSRLLPDNATSPYYWSGEIRLVKSCLKNTFPNWLVTNGIADFNALKDNFYHIGSDGNAVIFKSLRYNDPNITAEEKKDLSIYNPSPTPEFPATTAQLRQINPLPPIGSFIESSFTDAQMQSLYPTGNFVLCDGRSCVGSYYWHIKGRPAVLNVPDLRNGQFLRPASLESKIGTFGAQGTRADALTCVVSDNTHNLTVGHNANLNHYHPYSNGGVTRSGQLDNGGGAHSATDYNTTTLVTDNANLVAPWTHLSSEHNFAISSTDAQTLPNFMSVNVFFRIN